MPRIIGGKMGLVRSGIVTPTVIDKLFRRLRATALGLQMHPMSQAPQEFDEMKPWYDRLHQTLLGKPAQLETVQMFCRIGYCAEQQHTPRRALDGFLMRS